MTNKISLTASMRTNLLSLQNISKQVDRTQQRLSTGNKVNSAIDNPSSYYTARSLTNRAGDLDALLDSMGQAVQTIKAATEGIDKGIVFLEQMQSVAEQALENPATAVGGTGDTGDTEQVPELVTKDLEEYLAQGYTAITADMSADEINALMTDGAKLVLAEDVTLNNSLVIGASVTIDGNGHKLTYDDSAVGNGAMIMFMGGDSTLSNISLDFTTDITQSGVSTAVAVMNQGDGASVDISSIQIRNPDDNGYGILAGLGGKVTLDSTGGIEVTGANAQKVAGDDRSGVYDGQSNTQKIVAQLGNKALAAYAATQFYVGDKNGDFGQGNWYLPSIGELMEMYGTDMSAVSDEFAGTSGATGTNKNLINTALSTLASAGVEAETLSGYYWSSSEYSAGTSWVLAMGNGGRNDYGKSSYGYVRVFQLVENCFNPSTLSASAQSKVGDVMYDDESWGSADDYAAAAASGKKAVGVITEVLDDGSVKIMNLKDLRFGSTDTAGNFDPEHPYSGSKNTQWATDDEWTTNINDLPDFWAGNITITGVSRSAADGGVNASSAAASVSAAAADAENTGAINAAYADQYNELLRQYDLLLDDASYKSINLLRGGELDVIFNELRDSHLNIVGQDLSSQKIGLSAAVWETKANVASALDEVRRGILTLRSAAGELGNNYSIVQNRQEFTENLINILTEGADKLVLADMNEESANMLALQTRQQLAVNSLSLASQSSQAVLKLF